MVAIIKGTASHDVIRALRRIPQSKRNKVKELTIDLAPVMELIGRRCFPKAQQVSDRFHVQKLAYDAVQEIRIKHRWEAIDQQNNEMQLAKQEKRTFIPDILENGDARKQLLVISRYLLFKSQDKWTPSQAHRAEILFRLYPDLKQAYLLSRDLASIFSNNKDKRIAFKKLALWYNKVEQAGFKAFNSVSRTIQSNYQSILN